MPQLLKLNPNDQPSKTAFKLIEKAIRNKITKRLRFKQWIIVLDAIAGSCLLNQRVLSEIYDFLTVAIKTIIEGRTKAIDDIFAIYRNIMANYELSVIS